MLDLGANVECSAENLLQFAVMGDVFARTVLGVAHPTIGILNIGAEDLKGREELRVAASMIRATHLANCFHGFVEGDDIAAGTVDVIVADGFTGNVALKTGEGTAKLISELLREAFNKTPLSKIAALLAMTSLKRLQVRIDPRRVNGGVFLGLNGTVIKSHGSADATGVAAAVALAWRLAQTGFAEKVAARVAQAITIPQDAAKQAPPAIPGGSGGQGQ
jgi:glycerol-3-phosphate acyltransferase PlsX